MKKHHDGGVIPHIEHVVGDAFEFIMRRVVFEQFEKFRAEHPGWYMYPKAINWGRYHRCANRVGIVIAILLWELFMSLKAVDFAYFSWSEYGLQLAIFAVSSLVVFSAFMAIAYALGYGLPWLWRVVKGFWCWLRGD